MKKRGGGKRLEVPPSEQKRPEAATPGGLTQRFRENRFLENRFLENTLPRYAVATQYHAQRLKGFQLNLPHPLTGKIECCGQLLQCLDLVTVKAVAFLDNIALLLAEAIKPLLNAVLYFRLLEHEIGPGRGVVRHDISHRQQRINIEWSIQ